MNKLNLGNKFDFSKKSIKKIKSAFKEFLKEAKRLGANTDLSNDKKQLVILSFINNTIEKFLDKQEKEQEIKYSVEERNYFKEKIFEIIEKDWERVVARH